jgi:hypothetical protein
MIWRFVERQITARIFICIIQYSPGTKQNSIWMNIDKYINLQIFDADHQSFGLDTLKIYLRKDSIKRRCDLTVRCIMERPYKYNIH